MKKFLVFLVMLLIMALPLSAFASSMTDESVLGNDRWSVTNEGDLIPVTASAYDVGSRSYPVGVIYFAGNIPPVEEHATGDTLVAADSGIRHVLVSASPTTDGAVFTLPQTATGLDMKIIATDARVIQIEPDSVSDTILYLTLDAGDQILSPGATGDSIRLICYKALYWAVDGRSGTFTDGGQ